MKHTLLSLTFVAALGGCDKKVDTQTTAGLTPSGPKSGGPTAVGPTRKADPALVKRGTEMLIGRWKRGVFDFDKSAEPVGYEFKADGTYATFGEDGNPTAAGGKWRVENFEAVDFGETRWDADVFIEGVSKNTIYVHVPRDGRTIELIRGIENGEGSPRPVLYTKQ